ncbi:MAG: hypothetical protein ACRDP8_18570 [Actinopolymorphaceae bacterium]
MRQSGSTYLFDLARSASAPASRRRRTKPAVTRVRPSLLGDLNGMTGTPAYVRNARLDILAVNDLCLALFDGVLTRDALPFNLARFVFLDPYAKAFYLDWDTIARDMVSSLRSRVGQDPSDRGLSDLIGELTTRSESFAQLWARHDVRLHRTSRKRLATRIVGATKPHHLSDAVAALDIDLTDDEVSALEQPYGPRLPTYF